ncbi:hypothetical protein jhhlp_001810 [Lomentospora prolificans]|uniref:DUF6590 domain-containing protein n=1 Tax=Lomentospora prolificans TaxID=41688 RepID=A0A2N3NGS2_9PEZI|nr:hypothetical protein jhhlp_001810 [Lomentospora prolificans]
MPGCKNQILTCHVRAGNIETAWGPVYDTERDDVPRQRNEDDDGSLAETFRGVQLEDEIEEGYDNLDGSDDGEYHVSSSNHAESSRKEKTRSSHRRDKEKEKDKPRDKGKAKEREKPKEKHKSRDKDRDKKGKDYEKRLKEQEQERRDRKGKAKQTHDDSSEGESEEEGGNEYEDPAAHPYYPSSTTPTPTTGEPDDQEEYYDSDEMRRAIHESRQASNLGGPSTLEYPPSESARTDSHHIASGAEYFEELDPRYRIEPSHKFQPGEVFKVLWPEPSGQADHKASAASEKREVRDNYGGKIYVGFRRFVVIGNDFGHCTCVPIFTYGGQGCKKRGVKPEKHGIITQLGSKARLVPGEPKLGMPPVRVRMIAEGEALAWQSRINYSKLITVEHNVKVFFIGRIHDEDYELVYDAVNACWEQKTFHKRHR